MKPCDLCGGTAAATVLEKDGGAYVRCPDCQFVYTWPELEPAEDSNRDFFEQALQRYIDTNYSAKLQRLYAKDLRALRPYFGEGRLLEVGCNVGGFLHCARELGWAATGVEPVEGCAEYARDKQGLDAVTGVLEEADLPENSFDVVYSNAVFEHIPNPGPAMAAIARVLAPGGVVYTKTVNFDCYTREQLGTGWRLLLPDVHVSLFNADTLTRFGEQAGLEVFRVQSNGVRVRKGAFAAIRKGILSFLSRRTLKGDRVITWARKATN
ncbi:MAG: class I SAM-dependent methyltransferase [Victivallales bacterium]|nr:class I SAM-dependent methyltransferase [Victivallales bacterium]